MNIKSIIKLALVFFVVGTSACSNEVDVTGTWQEIPVIYGFLEYQNIYDSVTYIRIEKAYLDENTSALEVAQIADSLYYNDADITVVLWERNTLNGGATEYTLVDTLVQVDLNLEGIVKDSGIFANSPNYAYKTHHDIQRGAFYRLEVHNHVTGTITRASTRTLNTNNSFIITKPILNTSNPYNNAVQWASYVDVTSSYVLGDVSFDWTAPDHADIYDMRVFINYAEMQVDLGTAGEPEIPGTRVCKQIVWSPLLNYMPDGVIIQKISGESFYNFLANELDPVDATTRRCMVDMDIQVDAGGEEYALYISAQNANTDLIGGLYPSDPYSNIENGFGMFSSKMRVSKEGFVFSEDSREYLSTGEITEGLGFKVDTCVCQ